MENKRRRRNTLGSLEPAYPLGIMARGHLEDGPPPVHAGANEITMQTQFSVQEGEFGMQKKGEKQGALDSALVYWLLRC